MLEDYQHMDIRGADVWNGVRLVFGDTEATMLGKECASVLASGPILMDPPPISVLMLNPVLYAMASGSMRMWRIGRRVKDYNRRWSGVSQKEKRDVIAALRTATKTAKYAALAIKILVWLA